MDKLLLDVDSVAERLSLGRTVIYRLIGDGSLRSIKVGKRRLIPVDALAEFVANQQAVEA